MSTTSTRFVHSLSLNEQSSNEFHQTHFEALKAAYPGRRLLIVSNTAGARSWDPKLKLAAAVTASTGVEVLSHSVKKPGCGPEIMDYFRKHPETGVTHPSQIAVVGDRLTTDMMLANMMGGWGFWVKDGVIPLKKKSIVSRPLSLITFPSTGSKSSNHSLQTVFTSRAAAVIFPHRSWIPTTRTSKPIRGVRGVQEGEEGRGEAVSK
jgi:HAD superfamily phosphatase (TIGR01668 family)